MFLISVLGAGVFGSVRVGVWLWLIHVASALLTGLVFRKSGHSTARQDVLRSFPCQAISLAGAFAEAMRTALNGTLAVCASVVLFYVLATPFRALGGLAGAALTGTVELFSLVPLLSPDRAGFILAAACAGWGGFSVLFQTIAVLEGSGPASGQLSEGQTGAIALFRPPGCGSFLPFMIHFGIFPQNSTKCNHPQRFRALPETAAGWIKTTITPASRRC